MGNMTSVEGPLVIAIDSSTQSTKAIVVDIAGNVVAEAKHLIPLLTPHMDFYEHDPALWWQTTRDSIADAVAKLTQVDRDRIKAIGITHQRESFAPFREDGTPLANGILWLDGRAVDQIARYGSAHLHELSGKPAGVTPAIYKMAWVKEHHPELFEKADRVAEVHAAIAFHLTGEWVTSQAAADSLGLFDIKKRDWSDELLAIAGVRREQMPRLVPPATSMGVLRPELAIEWRIPTVEVIAGLGDGQAAGIGAAAVDPGIGYLNMGTAVNAGIESSHYVYDPAFRTHVSGIPGSYVMEVLQSSGSYLADWVRNTFADPDNPGSCDVVRDTEKAAHVAPGCDGLITLPYWNAVQSPYWDAKARGVVVGWRGTHTRAHFYRSTLESIGFEMRRNLDYLEKAGGERIRELRIMGGGTRSELWRQIMADIIGVPLVVCSVDEVSAFGAAVLAMAGIGAHGAPLPDGAPDVAGAAKAMARFGETVEPNQGLRERYKEIGAIQAKIYPQMKEIFAELDDVVRKHDAS
ncbi:MAG: FGGY-family carbohydrate kinase [Ancrocorticia sp.]|jgi:xylulokinase|nr:FGGY-family carbohydrate kinase [Ancrocorticia sp.]MCI1964426.1 FGGY-family carbohydrate kinase [Ancrocorticia sp.]MCI2002237.1 FGGY-family carbohydrate kinase [Ancrocorticia sp.]MCI2179245.1 FGGY-family carbohydrate kinase [Ancrocorticia sp.]MCI2194377.1 FGGY-family carbohydrate kinase [Ancrocorticia sp.]